MSRPRLSRSAWIVLGAVLLLAKAPAAAPESAGTLVVQAADGAPLASLALPADGRWCLLWHHSVQGFQVEDCYRVADGQMLLSSTHTPDFAAGLGHTPGRGRLLSDTEHGYRIVDIDAPVPANRFLLRVGSMRVDHRIAVGKRRLSLSQLAAGERVEIRLIPSTDGPSSL
ncbi:DUF1850 domain-containing protein [Saccharospirillum sp. HFRX-1]|uniref:DUF1850 domain-containing protein n=1 Tax=unclassified Saccharospirillum TaxID=2633430 RepID=UPI003724A96F